MTIALAAEPKVSRFSVRQEELLLEELRRVDRTTDVLPVARVGEVEMNAAGVLGCGLRPTTWCLYQLCHSACSGLYQLLVEMMAPGGEERRLAAVGVYNQVVRVGFDPGLLGKRLLCDRGDGTADALVSEQYQHLPNLRLFEQATAAAASLSDDVRFCEATLRGRWLLLRYYAIATAFEADGMRYHAGYHFSNHEGGRSSLRASAMLLRSRGLLGFLPGFALDRRVRHIGRRAESLAGDLVERTFRSTPGGVPLEAIGGAVAGAAGMKLGLGLPEPKQEEARRDELARRLRTRCLLPVSLAARVVAGAALQAHDAPAPKELVALSRRELESRTVLDLSIAASREARRCDVAMREKLEQAAYGLLLGKTKVG